MDFSSGNPGCDASGQQYYIVKFWVLILLSLLPSFLSFICEFDLILWFSFVSLVIGIMIQVNHSR